MGIKQIFVAAVGGFFVLTALNNSPDSANTENQPVEILIETEQAQNTQQAGNVLPSHDKVVVDIIKFIEQFEAENQWLSRISMPSDEEQAKYDAVYADIEDTKMDIANHLANVVNKFSGKSIPQNIYNLYSNGKYGNFSISGNVLPRSGVTYDKWERGEYSYEVINGFWDGNTDYPVVSVDSDRDFHFNSNLNTRTNTIFVLDVNSIAYVDGAIYANVLTLKRWVENTSNGNQNSWVLMESGSPMLYRFVFSARNNGDSQNPLENVRISVDRDYFVTGSSNLFYLKSGIRDWYNPATSQRDFPQTLEWALGKPGVIELDDSFYTCRDILIFSIYKLSVGM